MHSSTWPMLPWPFDKVRPYERGRCLSPTWNWGRRTSHIKKKFALKFLYEKNTSILLLLISVPYFFFFRVMCLENGKYMIMISSVMNRWNALYFLTPRWARCGCSALGTLRHSWPTSGMLFKRRWGSAIVAVNKRVIIRNPKPLLDNFTFPVESLFSSIISLSNRNPTAVVSFCYFQFAQPIRGCIYFPHTRWLFFSKEPRRP